MLGVSEGRYAVVHHKWTRKPHTCCAHVDCCQLQTIEAYIKSICGKQQIGLNISGSFWILRIWFLQTGDLWRLTETNMFCKILIYKPKSICCPNFSITSVNLQILVWKPNNLLFQLVCADYILSFYMIIHIWGFGFWSGPVQPYSCFLS